MNPGPSGWVTVMFSESVTGFDATDLTLTNATASNFTCSGASYSFDLMPSGQGTVSVSVAANKLAKCPSYSPIAGLSQSESVKPAGWLWVAERTTADALLSSPPLSQRRHVCNRGAMTCE